MKRYVAGLLFDDTGSQVALIQKNRPEWQAGFYNAVGGKVEYGETVQEAMRREFVEEAGVDIEWLDFLIVAGKNFEVSFFRYWSSEALSNVTSKTDEEIHIFSTRNLPADLVNNIEWLVPLMSDKSIELPLLINRVD